MDAGGNTSYVSSLVHFWTKPTLARTIWVSAGACQSTGAALGSQSGAPNEGKVVIALQAFNSTVQRDDDVLVWDDERPLVGTC